MSIKSVWSALLAVIHLPSSSIEKSDAIDAMHSALADADTVAKPVEEVATALGHPEIAALVATLQAAVDGIKALVDSHASVSAKVDAVRASVDALAGTNTQLGSKVDSVVATVGVLADSHANVAAKVEAVAKVAEVLS